MIVLPPAVVELGGYINGFKLLPFALISLVWLRLMTWADKDAEDARLPRQTTNLIHLGLWIVGIGLGLVMPLYIAAVAIFIVFFAIDVAIYLSMRKKSVGLADLSKQFADWRKNIGKKEKIVSASEHAVVLIDKGGKPLQPPTDDNPQRPAFDAIQSILSQPLRYNARRIDLRPTDGGSVVRYTVDGVTMEGKSVPKEAATAAIELMKQMAGLDPADKRKPQTGKMKITTETARHEAEIYTAGSTSGEMMRITLDFKKLYDFRVDGLGFLSDQNKTILETVAEPGGIVLLTAPDGQGQTNLAYAMLKQHDAFLSNIQTLERDPPIELEGITQNKLAANAGTGEETKQIDWMISQQPDVIFLDRCDDPRTAIDLAKYCTDGHRGYVAMRAANTFDALAQWRKLIGDDKLAIDSLKLVVAERLVRTLCEACKVAYTPEPEALKKMNMSPERVTKLFQPRKEPMRDQKGNEIICQFCQGLAYKGRTGVFELFKIDDEVRAAVQAGGTVNQFKGLFRKQKQRYLQEAALARVEKGDTSVEEVLRVLRGPSSSSSTRSSSAALA
ncbi:MAG: gspE 2 [Phycisphaerales bacterium]|nr:gspE 2 [Phycisphaerales bacterium]